MSDETRTVTVEQLADDVRYAGGNGSDYWRGFNDGIDKLVQRLAALPTSTEGLDPDTLATAIETYAFDTARQRMLNLHRSDVPAFARGVANTYARLASLSPSPTEDPA